MDTRRLVVQLDRDHCGLMTDDHIPDQTDRVALVTGATGGIGRAIAAGLARSGATVIVAARDLARGEAVAREISTTAVAMELDVADQSSIRGFVAAFRRRHGRLDLLVNNAGAWFSDRRTSPDGHELTLATNVLGPFLLTSLLEDALRAAPAARVVNVVSSLASSYDPDDLQ